MGKEKKLKAYTVSNCYALGLDYKRIDRNEAEWQIVFDYSIKDVRKNFRSSVHCESFFDFYSKRNYEADKYIIHNKPHEARRDEYIHMFYNIGWACEEYQNHCDYCGRCEYKDYPKSKIDYDFSACIECSEKQGFYNV